MFPVQCTVYSVKYTVYSVRCTVCSVQCTVCCVQCVVCSVQCATYSLLCLLSTQEQFFRHVAARMFGPALNCTGSSKRRTQGKSSKKIRCIVINTNKLYITNLIGSKLPLRLRGHRFWIHTMSINTKDICYKRLINKNHTFCWTVEDLLKESLIVIQYLLVITIRYW